MDTMTTDREREKKPMGGEMRKSALPIVCSLLLLTACDGRLDSIKGCLLGEEKPVPLQEAIKVVKAAGLEFADPLDAFVASQGGLPQAAQPAAPARKFTLLCVATVSGQRLTTVLSVDLDAGTVNGAIAKISPTEITWQTSSQYQGRNTVSAHTLNRLNGDWRSHTEGVMYAAPPPTYACAPAPKPAF